MEGPMYNAKTIMINQNEIFIELPWRYVDHAKIKGGSCDKKEIKELIVMCYVNSGIVIISLWG
jgi:hypothetical protein